MDYPYISAVMPTKNRKRFVAESVRRFLAQDYPGGAELVIVEDGEENSHGLAVQTSIADVCNPAREGSPISYYRCDGSIGAKLNFAAQLAQGEVIANWDDDDWYAPDRLRRQHDHMRLTGKAVIGCCSSLFYREGDVEGWEYHGTTSYAAGFSHMYRRDWALAHPHPDVSVGEDVFYMQTAHELGDLSTVSGLDVMVARDHDANTCPRERGGFDLHGIHFHGSDNWREVPLSRIAAVIGR